MKDLHFAFLDELYGGFPFCSVDQNYVTDLGIGVGVGVGMNVTAQNALHMNGRTGKLVKSYQSSSVIIQGRLRETFCLFNRRLVTAFYGVLIVAGQERARKSWMSRETPHVTTKPKPTCYDLTNILIRPISVLTLWISEGLTQS